MFPPAPPAPSPPTSYRVVSLLHLPPPPHYRNTYKKNPLTAAIPTPFTPHERKIQRERTAAADHPTATSPPQDTSPAPCTTCIPNLHICRFFPNLCFLPAFSEHLRRKPSSSPATAAAARHSHLSKSALLDRRRRIGPWAKEEQRALSGGRQALSFDPHSREVLPRRPRSGTLPRHRSNRALGMRVRKMLGLSGDGGSEGLWLDWLL